MYFSRLHGAAKSKPIHSTHLGSQNESKCYVHMLEIQGDLKSSTWMTASQGLRAGEWEQHRMQILFLQQKRTNGKEENKKITTWENLEMQEFVRKAEENWQWEEARRWPGSRQDFAEREEGFKSSGEEQNNGESCTNQSPTAGGGAGWCCFQIVQNFDNVK